jgi:HlyD family secretion protein
MRPGQNALHPNEAAQRAARDPNPDAYGPHGAALILELQQLRRDFDGEIRSNQDTPRARRPAPEITARPARTQASRPKRRKKKGRIGQVIDFCLEQVGFRSVAPTERRMEPPDAAPVTPPRHPSPGLAPTRPLSMEWKKPAPEIPAPDAAHLSMVLADPQFKPSGPPAPATTVGRLLRTASAGLIAGGSFLLNRSPQDPANDAADVGLMMHAGWSFENELRTGLRILLLATLLGGGWLALVPLAGAVVVPGNLVVQSNVKTIQHPAGGVVAEIKAANGARVAAGDLLLRLDPTQAQASLQIVTKQLDEVRARIARLTAERDGLSQPEFPPALMARPGQDVRSLLASEVSLFKARSDGRMSQKGLLQSRIGQLSQEISGLEAQVDSKAKQLELIAGELVGVKDLYDKRLVPLTRLTTLQRETARIEGERGQLTSSIAETKSKIGEAQLQIARLDQDFRTEVVKELGETQGKEAELVERGVAARDLLDRIEMRAPTSGVIHKLSAHTIGGVIRPGDVIMEIVPDTDDLLVEARLQPQDIDQVRPGQKAFVRFSAFNQRVTPQLTGTVSLVSADTSHDQQTNASYFTVRVVLPDDERRRLGGLQLVPGMPAEVFMQTGSRTMMNYLLKPITEQMNRAFVER